MARRPDGSALPQVPPGHQIDREAAATARAPSRFRSIHEIQTMAEHELAWYRTLTKRRIDALNGGCAA